MNKKLKMLLQIETFNIIGSVIACMVTELFHTGIIKEFPLIVLFYFIVMNIGSAVGIAVGVLRDKLFIILIALIMFAVQGMAQDSLFTTGTTGIIADTALIHSLTSNQDLQISNFEYNFNPTVHWWSKGLNHSDRFIMLSDIEKWIKHCYNDSTYVISVVDYSHKAEIVNDTLDLTESLMTIGLYSEKGEWTHKDPNDMIGFYNFIKQNK